MSLIIKGATIVDSIADNPLRGASVLVENGRISRIGCNFELPSDAQVIDAHGKFLIPGLMDANVHLMGAFRMEDLARFEGAYEDLIAEAAQIALRSGLTTVFDTWGPRQALMNVRDKINAGDVPGSRIFCAGNIVGLDGPISIDFNSQAVGVASSQFAQRINSLWVENTGPDLSWMGPDEVCEEVRHYIATGIDFLKYASSEHRDPGPTSFLVFSPRIQQRIVDEGHGRGLTVQAHTTSLESLHAALEAGCDIIQHANITGPVPISGDTLALLAERRTNVVLFPFTQRRLDYISANAEAHIRRHWSTADTNCRTLMTSGATILLGTDAMIRSSNEPATVAGEESLFELGEGHFNWCRAMEQKGFSPLDCLRAATINIANAYRKTADLGSIEEGKIADLIVLDRDPLQSTDNLRSISVVIKDGTPVDLEALPRTSALTITQEPDTSADLSYGKLASSKFPMCGCRY